MEEVVDVDVDVAAPLGLVIASMNMRIALHICSQSALLLQNTRVPSTTVGVGLLLLMLLMLAARRRRSAHN
jgi:MYXO-CTERM domain-containing protein